MQLQMRGRRGRRGELETADGRSVGWIELGGRDGLDRVEVAGHEYQVTSASERRSWVVAADDAAAGRVEVRRPSGWKVGYQLTLDDGRVFEVAPVSRIRRRLALTEVGAHEPIGRLERRRASFRTVWIFELDASPAVVRAACVWIAVAIDREDEATNVAAVTS